MSTVQLDVAPIIGGEWNLQQWPDAVDDSALGGYQVWRDGKLVGGTLGTFMWYNVWFVIWPRQKMAIASAEAVASGGEADPEAAAQAPIAGRASRTNTLFSIPMLFFMGAARHLTGLQSGDGSYLKYYAAMLAIILLVELNIFYGAAATQKPLGSVSGTIHAGLWATLVLFLCASYML